MILPLTPLAAMPPILSCDEARELEAQLFAGDEAREWAAMRRAGAAVARAVLEDCREIGGFPDRGRILVLVGKGHNGGDSLLAAATILLRFPAAEAEIVFVFGERTLRSLAARAWQALVRTAGKRVRRHASLPAGEFHLCLDGIFGFQFRPPVEPRVAELIARVNDGPVRLRAAVDLPSAGLFRADFTYATGSVKAPVLQTTTAGRVRYLDLGFFRGDEPGAQRVLASAILQPLAALRPSQSDKRTYGHLFVVGGSRSFPGAILMTVQAALRSGVGLVTAFVPESVMPAFAARAPEAMWVAWPETPGGGLALEGEHLLGARMSRATALVMGPGLGREPETMALAASMAGSASVPLVIDADALQPDVVHGGSSPRIVTPHAGEFARISGGKDAGGFGQQPGRVLVLKGPVTQVAHAGQIHHSFFGGPVLARGGSGDLLAGLIGGLLAQTPADPLLAAARGVVWHGMAADLLAREFGQTPVRVTQLLDFLPAALRASVPSTTDADEPIDHGLHG